MRERYDSIERRVYGDRIDQSLMTEGSGSIILRGIFQSKAKTLSWCTLGALVLNVFSVHFLLSLRFWQIEEVGISVSGVTTGFGRLVSDDWFRTTANGHGAQGVDSMI